VMMAASGLLLSLSASTARARRPSPRLTKLEEVAV
jgi:hypothetical protein